MNLTPTPEEIEARANPPSFAEAACRDTDPSLFFGDSATVGVAKRICMECPIREICLDYAIRAGERWGVWGGVAIASYREGLVAA